MDRYLIGDILLRMDYGGMRVEFGNNLSLFRYDGPWEGEELTFRGTFEALNCDPNEIVRHDNHVYEIYRRGNENRLVYHWGNLFHGFTVWPERFCASFSPDMERQPALREDWFFSIISFHRQLLQRQAGVFHASYIDAGGRAVLFTGPSNVGKSTQAALWEKYAGVRVINGDRVVLRRRDGVWHAYGYPCCGTSGICVNRTLPLGAIVVLEQANENRVVQLSAAQKIRALVSATELYPWDAKELDMAFSIAEQIAGQVPVVKLSCRPDAQAVDVLKEYLEENGYANRI